MYRILRPKNPVRFTHDPDGRPEDTPSMSMPLDSDSHRNAAARFRNSDDLEPVRRAAWSVHAIDEAAEEVRAIVAKHLTPTDSTKALQALNHVYVGAPQNVKDAIVHNPDALLILECAAGEANAPLTKTVAGPVLPQERTHAAMLCLQQATRRLDARLAAAVVGLAMPGHEAFYERNEGILPAGGLFGPAGADLLRDVVDCIAGTPEGDDVAARLMAMGGATAKLNAAAAVEASRELRDCDLIALAQYSMAPAAALVADASGRPVLTTPDSAVLKLKELLAG
jgi:hypothetical protein